MIQMDVIIIGGGAAGLMAAAHLVNKGVKVTLLEKGGQCGKKILITGKGRCNLTNYAQWPDFSTHIHPDSNFFKTAFYNFSNYDTIAFFEKCGMPVTVERGGRVFPSSLRSVDVRDTLLDFIKKGGIEVLCNKNSVGIQKKDDSSFTVVVYDECSSEGNDKTILFSSPVLILATGGLSYPLTGSTGDGLEFSKALSHTIVDTFPSLTALKPEYRDNRLDGLTLNNIKLELLVNGKSVQSEFGELTFTEGGIEGALGFRVSRKGVKALLEKQKVEIEIDLKPALSLQQLSLRITREISDLRVTYKGDNKRNQLKKVLKTLLPSQMIDPFIDSNVIGGISLANLPLLLKRWHFNIVGYVGYERAVITAGGVSLDEISRKNMESKRVPRLFFAGEIVNLDGDTGGYNLQIAFSTGALAAKGALAELRR